MPQLQTRRSFVKNSMAAAAVLGAPALVSGRNLNDKILMGFIGIGNRGSQLLNIFMTQPDVQVTALCDIYEPFLQRDRAQVDHRFSQSVDRIPPMGESFPKSVKRYHDFRRLLDDKQVDAVCIATPDHWHALQTIAACRAGKDVYIEKPLSITLREGRRMVQVARETNRVVTVGIHRRASPIYQKLVAEILSGKIGHISVASAARINNMMPDGIGVYPQETPPPDFDWDMWLGPRAWRPFQFNIAPYKFRWWSDYSSQMGNWGVHYLDAIRWMLDETAPVAVTAVGSRRLIHDDADIPDTMEAIFEMPSGVIVKFSIHEACSGELFRGDVELRGSDGNVVVDEGGYRIWRPEPGQFQKWQKVADEEPVMLSQLAGESAVRDSTVYMVRNFIDCIRSREVPYCSLEEGHRSTSFAHLANIALKRERRLIWDGEAERFTNDDAANALLVYQYRSPWTLDM